MSFLSRSDDRQPLEVGGYGRSERRARRRPGARVGVAAGAAVLVALPALRGVFSANVTLNADTGIEFGQGVSPLVTCDAGVQIAVGTVWNDTDQAFEVDRFTVSGIDGVNCAGKTLTLSAYATATPVAVCATGCSADGKSFTVQIASSTTTVTFESVVPGLLPSAFTNLAVTTS